MRKFALLILLLLIIQNASFARSAVYNEDGKFGLKSETGEVITLAKYKKLIRLGESGWIFQSGSKFGVMDDSGKILVEPKYNKADRFLGKYAKLTRGEKTGLFDEKGFEILPPVYSSIDLLYGGMLLTNKNYKYGITDHNGQAILDNIFDDIYMPKPNVMVITYNGQTYEIEGANKDQLTLPQGADWSNRDSGLTITELVSKPVVTTGYYGVSATNYLLKIFSSISSAYEQTIDELMFAQGADAAGVIMKFTWVPRFPVVYVRKYCQNLTAPNNGPLNEVKANLKKQLVE